MTANSALATRARELADQSAPGSLERRAAGCVVVAAATTRTIPAARRALETVREADVRAAAFALLEDLAQEPVKEAHP